MRYFAFLFWVLAAFAQPAAAATSPSLQPLEQKLSWLMSARSGDIGLAALDLRTGELVSIRGGDPFPMASTVKIAVAANYLAQVEYGRRSLDDVIAGRSARSLMEAMIIRSDNGATDLLLRDLGGPEVVQSWLDQRKITGLRIDCTIAQLLRARRDLYDVRDSSTPEAMVELLRQLDSGKLLRPESRSYLLGLMARCSTGKNRMRALLPYGTLVEHKTGTLSGLTTDVGFLTLPDGRRIAVAFFVRGGADRPRTIAEAARAIYDGLVYSVRRPFVSQATAVTAVPVQAGR